MTTTKQTVAAASLSMLVGLSFGYGTRTVTEPLRVLDMCGLPGVRCEPIPPALQAELEELTLCCSYFDGECSIVESLNSCHPSAEYAVICEWGRTTAAGEIECYD